MASIARDEMGHDRLPVIADRGYFNSQEIKACIEAGIAPLVPKPRTSNAKADGRFRKADFIYLKKVSISISVLLDSVRFTASLGRKTA